MLHYRRTLGRSCSVSCGNKEGQYEDVHEVGGERVELQAGRGTAEAVIEAHIGEKVAECADDDADGRGRAGGQYKGKLGYLYWVDTFSPLTIVDIFEAI